MDLIDDSIIFLRLALLLLPQVGVWDDLNDLEADFVRINSSHLKTNKWLVS